MLCSSWISSRMQVTPYPGRLPRVRRMTRSERMDVVIIGDGPGGLSAALFLAKNGMSTVVYGQDKTAMHWALLKNYLGVPEISGTDFQSIARTQVSAFGGRV